MSKPEWSKEYCRLTYLGELSDEKRASVQRWHRSATLTKYVRGIGVVGRKNYRSVKKAQNAGRRWINS